MAVAQNNRGHFEKNVEAVAASTLTWVHSNNGVCSIQGAKAALIDDRIVFTGANMKDRPGRPIQSGQLYSLSLNETRSVNQLFDEGLFVANHDTNAQHPKIETSADGPFWYGNDSLYALSQSSNADIGVSDNARKLWSLKLPEDFSGGVWEQVSSFEASWSQSELESAPYASAPGVGLAFVADLERSDGSKIMMLNTSNERPEWEMKTSVNFGDSVSRTGASMFFAPFGQSGVLFFIGGNSRIGNTSNFMEEVDVFDLASSKWFSVQTVPHESTNGTSRAREYPGSRSAFCGWPANDDSSYSIVIHGGTDKLAPKVYGDIWALSIPSFRWVKIDTNESVTMHSHVCLRHRENYGFALGGDQYSDIREADCSEASPLKLFDLSKLQWVEDFVPTTAVEYRPNDKLVFPDPNPDLPEELRNILNTRMSQTDPKTSGGDNPDTTVSTPKSASNSLLSIGAKVGIGLGIAIAILLVALGGLFFLKRRGRRSARSPASKHFPTDDFRTEDSVTKDGTHVETRYRGSVLPPDASTDIHLETHPHGSVAATSQPHEQRDPAHGLPARAEVHSTTSHYSNDLFEHHNEQQLHEHSPADDRERRASLDSVVSSLAETTAPTPAEEPSRGMRAGVSPILSPVSPVRTSHEGDFRLDERSPSSAR